MAEEVREAHGTAGVWLARPVSGTHPRELAAAMATARADELIGGAAGAAGRTGERR